MRLTTAISVSGNGICLFACLFVVVAVVVVWRFQNSRLTFFIMNGPLKCISLPNIRHDSHLAQRNAE